MKTITIYLTGENCCAFVQGDPKEIFAGKITTENVVEISKGFQTMGYDVVFEPINEEEDNAN
jgi:hypothetical protein